MIPMFLDDLDEMLAEMGRMVALFNEGKSKNAEKAKKTCEKKIGDGKKSKVTFSPRKMYFFE